MRRVNRNRNLDLGAYVDNLPGSDGAGRGSFVKGAAPQNLEAALKSVALEILGAH